MMLPHGIQEGLRRLGPVLLTGSIALAGSFGCLGMDFDDDDDTEEAGAASSSLSGSESANSGSNLEDQASSEAQKAQTAIPDTKDLGAKIKLPVELKMTPLPKKSGGNLFLAGFIEIDEERGTPTQGSFPDHYIPVAIWVEEFPWKGELELVPGLYYYARYGHSSFPEPRDRFSWPIQAPSESGKPLVFDIGPVTQLSGQSQEELNATNFLPVGPNGEILPLRNLRNSEMVPVAVRLETADNIQAAPGPKRIGVIGFELQAGSTAAEPSQEPVFIWTSKPRDFRLPSVESIPLPRGLAFLLVLASSEGFNFDDDDLKGDLSPPIKKSTKPLTYSFNSLYGAVKSPEQREIPLEPTQLLAAQGVKYSKVKLSLSLDRSLGRSKAKGTLYVIGTKAGEQASSSEKPDFLWASDESLSRWPTEIEALMPDGLDVMLFLDQNGDRSPDKGDLSGERLLAFTAPKDAKLSYTLTGPWDPQAKQENKKRALQLAPGVDIVPVRLKLDIASGISNKPSKGRLVIAGYLPNADIPKEETPPFAWMSPNVIEKWPATVDAPLPVNLDVQMFLDVNASNSPDEGDLLAEGLRPFTPTPQQKIDVQLDRSWEAEKETKSVLEAAPGVKHSPMNLTIDVPRKFRRGNLEGHVLITGSFPDPSSATSERPAFFWASTGVISDWPATLDVVVPDGLDVRIVIDRNTNRTPDAEDLEGEVLLGFKQPPSGKFTYEITGSYERAVSTSEAGNSQPNTQRVPFPGQ